jgi:hypothetical protein
VKKTKIGECCPVMELVLSRELPARRPTCGLELAPWFSTSGKSGQAIVLHFPKSKDREAEHADATYAPVKFCPFCGTPTEKKLK